MSKYKTKATNIICDACGEIFSEDLQFCPKCGYKAFEMTTAERLKSREKQRREKAKRTFEQNNALHRWYELKSKQVREAGIPVQAIFEKTFELEMTPELMKEIWRMVQKAMFKKRSTTELNKIGEIDDIVEHLNRFFAENWNLPGLEFPHDETKSYQSIAPIGYRNYQS